MQSIILFHNSKWYFPFWALFFIMSLILLGYRRKNWKEGYDAFFWTIVLAIASLYCPLIAKALIPRFLPSYAEYERLAWIFFEVPLLSYVLIMLKEEFDRRSYKYIFVAAVLFVLLLIGSPDNRELYQKPDNKYKISADAVYICDKLNALSTQKNRILCIQVDSGEHYAYGAGLDGNLYYGIRTYDPSFSLHFKVVHPEQYTQKGFKLPNGLAADIDYYICPKSENIYNELDNLGYKYVDESENFAIFHNEMKKSLEMGYD